MKQKTSSLLITTKDYPAFNLKWLISLVREHDHENATATCDSFETEKLAESGFCSEIYRVSLKWSEKKVPEFSE